jgi:hypothetical protein
LLFRNPVARALAPLFPLQLRRFLATITPSKSMQELLQIVRIMDRSSKKVLRSKRASIEKGDGTEQIGAGKDLMSTLRKLKSRHSIKQGLIKYLAQCVQIYKAK